MSGMVLDVARTRTAIIRITSKGCRLKLLGVRIKLTAHHHNYKESQVSAPQTLRFLATALVSGITILRRERLA